ncbi:MAG TPA: F0F1 ATP synthase subunit B [Spongiibacteraceae bacterium]
MNINYTLYGQTITFFIFLWFCYTFVWSAIRKMMDERAKKIADGLEAADRANHDLELAKEKVAQQLRHAKEEAAVIIDAANKRASQIIEEAKEQARTEADRIKTAANAEIEQEMNRAKEQLRGKVAALALAGAEKVLQASIDQNQHKALVENLAASL